MLRVLEKELKELNAESFIERIKEPFIKETLIFLFSPHLCQFVPHNSQFPARGWDGAVIYPGWEFPGQILCSLALLIHQTLSQALADPEGP